MIDTRQKLCYNKTKTMEDGKLSTRSQVYMKNSGVYLYKHLDGYDLENIVRKALQRKERWTDVEYLTRIIFSEMIKDDLEGSIGFGIGTTKHSDIEYLVTVNVNKQTVKVTDVVKNLVTFKGTFEEFVKGGGTVQAGFQPDSSVIDNVTYNHSTRELSIIFVSGNTYTYDNVEPEVFDEFRSAPSAGRYYNRNIKGQYTGKE